MTLNLRLVHFFSRYASTQLYTHKCTLVLPLCTAPTLPWRSLAMSSLQCGLKIRQVSSLHETPCLFSCSGGRNPLLLWGIQWEDVSLIAMITWKARGCCCWGFGVSLCILGMMDEMIQPKRRGQLSRGKLRPPVVQRWKHTRKAVVNIAKTCLLKEWHVVDIWKKNKISEV